MLPGGSPPDDKPFFPPGEGFGGEGFGGGGGSHEPLYVRDPTAPQPHTYQPQPTYQPQAGPLPQKMFPPQGYHHPAPPYTETAPPYVSLSLCHSLYLSLIFIPFFSNIFSLLVMHYLVNSHQPYQQQQVHYLQVSMAHYIYCFYSIIVPPPSNGLDLPPVPTGGFPAGTSSTASDGGGGGGDVDFDDLTRRFEELKRRR